MVRVPTKVYLHEWENGNEGEKPKLNDDFQRRIERVYRQDAKMFDRFVTPNSTGDPIYKSSPTFLVTTKCEPPIPGGLTDILDNLTYILFRPSPNNPGLPTLKELRNVG
jgi:hypothetical protein